MCVPLYVIILHPYLELELYSVSLELYCSTYTYIHTYIIIITSYWWYSPRTLSRISRRMLLSPLSLRPAFSEYYFLIRTQVLVLLHYSIVMVRLSQFPGFSPGGLFSLNYWLLGPSSVTQPSLTQNLRQCRDRLRSKWPYHHTVVLFSSEWCDAWRFEQKLGTW